MGKNARRGHNRVGGSLKIQILPAKMNGRYVGKGGVGVMGSVVFKEQL